MGINELDQKPEFIEALLKFASKPRGFFLISGKNGTGKSFAAMEVYRQVARYQLPAYDDDDAIFINQAELNVRWTQTKGETHHLLRTFQNTCLLVLDDVGTRKPTEAFMDFLYALIDKRYTQRDKRGTIITTNLTWTLMREDFGDAFTSRVASGYIFRLEGEDRRLLNKEF